MVLLATAMLEAGTYIDSGPSGSGSASLVPKLLRGWSKEPGTNCLCMLSYPRISGALETSGYYTAISLCPSSFIGHVQSKMVVLSEESGNEATLILMVFRL